MRQGVPLRLSGPCARSGRPPKSPPARALGSTCRARKRPGGSCWWLGPHAEWSDLQSPQQCYCSCPTLGTASWFRQPSISSGMCWAVVVSCNLPKSCGSGTVWHFVRVSIKGRGARLTCCISHQGNPSIHQFVQRLFVVNGVDEGLLCRLHHRHSEHRR